MSRVRSPPPQTLCALCALCAFVRGIIFPSKFHGNFFKNQLTTSQKIRIVPLEID